MLTLKERKQLHRAFWSGTLKKPLLGLFQPFDSDLPGMDIILSPEDVVTKNRRAVEFFQTTPDQRIPLVTINFGPVFPIAVTGGEIKWDNHTSWAEPQVTSIDDVMLQPINTNHPIWLKYMELNQALVETDFFEAMISPAGLIGPFDILAALTGTELLCIECLVHPEKVANLAKAATAFWIDFYDLNLSIVPQSDGIATRFGLFCPGKGALWSEDFIALCGPDVYKDLVLPCDIQITEHLDTSYIHVHSGGIKCLEHILGIPKLSGVEISNDPNGPPLEEIIDWAQEAYRHGKSVMLSNWERHSSKKDVEFILSKIDLSRTIVTLDAKNTQQAELWSDIFNQ